MKSAEQIRQESIKKAHEDNMLANQMLVDAILRLVTAIDRLGADIENNTTASIEAARGAK